MIILDSSSSSDLNDQVPFIRGGERLEHKLLDAQS